MNSNNIKSFADFFSSKSKGCVMMKVECPEWNNLCSLISKEDLYINEDKKGLETDPHITVLFGLNEDVSIKEIEVVLKDFTIPEAKGVNVSIFESQDCDVLKIGIESEDLNKMNSALKSLPHEASKHDYHPHITIGYIKKGCAQKYINFIKVPEFTLTDCVYSDPDKKHTTLQINNE